MNSRQISRGFELPEETVGQWDVETALTEKRAQVLRVPGQAPEGIGDLLVDLFSVERAVDVTDTVGRRDEMAGREAEFREQPTRPVKLIRADMPVEAGSALIRADLEIEGVDGELALVAEGPARFDEIVLRERRELVTVQESMPFGHWIAVCSADGIVPRPVFGGSKTGRLGCTGNCVPLPPS
ncbi:MAG: hypothetical protein ABEN55_14345 [Bradymonadaceae bacterium]